MGIGLRRLLRDRNIVTGPIKANLPLRICLKVTNAVNSQIILDEPGGESLVGRGDLLCDRGKGTERAQAPFVEAGALQELLEKNGTEGAKFSLWPLPLART